MKVKIMKNQPIPYLKHCAMADIAAIAAMDALEEEGLYIDDAAESLWETAWHAADKALVCEEADLAEAEHIATEAARRHALAIPGRRRRWELVSAGKLIPAYYY